MRSLSFKAKEVQRPEAEALMRRSDFAGLPPWIGPCSAVPIVGRIQVLEMPYATRILMKVTLRNWCLPSPSIV